MFIPSIIAKRVITKSPIQCHCQYHQSKEIGFSLGFIKLFIKPGCGLCSINPSSSPDSQKKTNMRLEEIEINVNYHKPPSTNQILLPFQAWKPWWPTNYLEHIRPMFQPADCKTVRQKCQKLIFLKSREVFDHPSLTARTKQFLEEIGKQSNQQSI